MSSANPIVIEDSADEAVIVIKDTPNQGDVQGPEPRKGWCKTLKQLLREQDNECAEKAKVGTKQRKTLTQDLQTRKGGNRRKTAVQILQPLRDDHGQFVEAKDHELRQLNKTPRVELAGRPIHKGDFDEETNISDALLT